MKNNRYLLQRRKIRNRSFLKKKLGGKLRLTVFRSNNHIYCQVIDDSQMKTLISSSTLDNNVKKKISHENKFIDETDFCSVSLLYLYGIDGEKREWYYRFIGKRIHVFLWQIKWLIARSCHSYYWRTHKRREKYDNLYW